MAIIHIFAAKSANNMWKDIFYVGIGGGIGSILRFIASRLVARYVAAEWLFAGTLVVNMTGCFLIGLLSGWMLAHQPENQSFRLLLIVGFCGGYTTFSTFAFENLRLIEANQWGLFALYTFTSVLVGLLAVWGGMKLVS
ncbi:putative membrane protein [Proteiniphilum saccharofermentans]|uniref:Fluoride-specific ion channel FluC n=2 Tax=Dysgonomonadaceae TaxID=2005520 RepID=A0A1R3SWH3_9BACT|nr:putative membrane protein [Proteiniphilum saccharofermentans]